VSRPHVPILVLGAFITALAVLLWAFRMDQLPRWLGAAAAAATYLVAGVVYLVQRRRRRALEAIPVPEASPSTVLLAIGIALAVAGTALGRWLTWVGAIAIAIALIGLATELSGGRSGGREPPQWTEPPEGWSPEA
jgi:divalent metal cation (Fe/Co/Zn/Cd) transporter